MKKTTTLLAVLLTNSVLINAGEYILADFESDTLHLSIKDGKKVKENMQFYIDSDNNPNTGITCDSGNVKGADYLIENGLYMRFTGADGTCEWEWSHIGGSWESGDYDVSVPLSDIGLKGTQDIKVGAHTRDSEWKLKYNYNQYGEDKNEMKQVSGAALDADGMMLEYTVTDGRSADVVKDNVLQAIIDAPGWGLPDIYVEHGEARGHGAYEDLQVTLQEKHEHNSNVIVPENPIYIMGLCNAVKAGMASSRFPSVTAMMPCRISVYTKDDGLVGISMMNATSPLFEAVITDMKKIIKDAID